MPKRVKIAGYRPLKKLKVIIKGLHVAAFSDFSVAYKLVLSIPLFALCIALYRWIDLTIILVATGLMLTAELVNSAIEILCDFVEQQENTQIGIIKDIAAAAAGVSIFVWGIVMTIEGIHLWKLAQS
jgi:diacylglycerol kinase